MKKKRVVTSIGILLCITCIYYRQQAPHALDLTKQACSVAAYPLLRIQQAIVEPFKQWLHGRRTAYKLEQILQETRTESEKLLAENIKLKSANSNLHDTETLRSFCARYESNCMRQAQIIARYLGEDTQYLLINAGTAHGVEPDMAVTYNATLLGKISEVYRWYSKVSLVTDHTCKVAVYSDVNHCKGIHEGANNETETTLSYVDHLQPVETNELLISSGEGLVFPEGFGVARIKKRENGALYHTITTTPLCDLRAISHCAVFAKGELKQATQA